MTQDHGAGKTCSSLYPILLTYALFPPYDALYHRVRDGSPGALLRFVCFYLPLWIGFTINVVLYLSVARTLRRFAAMSNLETSSLDKEKESPEELEASRQQHRLIRMANHLSWYPLIFVVSWLANTAIRVIQAADPSTSTSYTLAFIHVCCDG